MLTARILIGAMMLAALGSADARALDVGAHGEDGYRFLYEEVLEAPYFTTWWGKQIGNNTRKPQVLIHTDEKTVFDGTLTIECGSQAMAWSDLSEWSTVGSVPEEMKTIAGKYFCGN